MRWTSTALVVLCVLALSGAARTLPSLLGAEGAAAVSGRGPWLRVSGHVSGLYPGVRKRLPVRVANRFPFPVRLRSIGARIGDAGPGCSRRNLSVRRYRGRLPISPHRSRRAVLWIAMAVAAPLACEGARFPIRFGARATR